MNSTETMLTPYLLTATEALADNLRASEPFAAYHRALARFNSNAEARALLERLSAAQADIRQKQPRNAVTQADLDQLRVFQREVQSNHVIIEYARAQQDAIAYLREINQEIGELLGVDFAALAGRSSC